MLVGTSVGALNATFLAADPTYQGAQRLARFWQMVRREDIYPGPVWSILWRLCRHHESLYSNHNFRCFLERYLDAVDIARFGDIGTGVRLYAVAGQLDSGEPRVFGDDPDEALLDALMASTAVPPLHPPWSCNGVAYIDGAVVAHLPIQVAVARGADEIYALHIARPTRSLRPPQGLQDMAVRALDAFLQGQIAHERQAVQERPDVRLYYVSLAACPELPYWDFAHAAQMIAAGRASMQDFFNQRRRARLWQRYGGAQCGRTRVEPAGHAALSDIANYCEEPHNSGVLSHHSAKGGNHAVRQASTLPFPLVDER